VVLFLLALGAGAVRLGLIRLRSMLVVAGVSFIVLTAIQSWMIGEWQPDKMLKLLIFRVGVSFPYYINIYPERLGYSGIDVGFSILGWIPPPVDNLEVFNYMYPDVWFTQGATAASAHLRAYAQGGWCWSAIMLTLIGIAFARLGTILSRSNGLVGHALYSQALVASYYLTQTSAIEAVYSSYGLCWAVIGVLPVFVIAAVLRASGQPSGKHNLAPRRRLQPLIPKSASFRKGPAKI
jgi:hypothetical protein